MRIIVKTDKVEEFGKITEELNKCLHNCKFGMEEDNKEEISLIILVSNSFKFVKESTNKINKDLSYVMNVTSNLSPEHVIESLKYVSDIFYAKDDVQNLANKIFTSFNRQKELRKIKRNKK